MSRGIDRKFAFGLLVGAGVGFAIAALVDARRGGPVRRRLLERAGDVAALVPLPGRPRTLGDRRDHRAERTLQGRVNRMRSAGY